MKVNFPLLTLAGATLLVASADSQAQYASRPYPYEIYSGGRFYVNGDLGGSIMQDMDLKNVGTKISFDPGVRADLAFGWQFLPPLAVEFETGALWNSLSRGGGLFLNSPGQKADLYQVPFLANLVGRVPLGGGLWAYLGGGLGGVSSEIDLRHNVDDGSFGFRHHASDTDFTFAYQGMTGLKYALAPDTEVGVGYKFLGTLNHTWFDGDPALFAHTGPAYSHSFLVSFTWRF